MTYPVELQSQFNIFATELVGKTEHGVLAGAQHFKIEFFVCYLLFQFKHMNYLKWNYKSNSSNSGAGGNGGAQNPAAYQQQQQHRNYFHAKHSISIKYMSPTFAYNSYNPLKLTFPMALHRWLWEIMASNYCVNEPNFDGPEMRKECGANEMDMWKMGSENGIKKAKIK